MSLPRIATREEWLAARKELLAKEKDLTRLRDALNAERRDLPMVEIEKDYMFDGPNGAVRLIDMFEGRPQLIIYHFMFDPDVGGRLPELHRRHRRAVAGLLRAPARPRHQLRHGVAGAAGQARAVEGQQGLGHPLVLVVRHRLQLRLRRHDRRVGAARRVQLPRPRPSSRPWATTSSTPTSPSRCPGRSCFLQVDGRVFHTYSQYARGLESTGGSYYFLDLTALGRQEEWEEPKGRSESARSATPDFAS